MLEKLKETLGGRIYYLAKEHKRLTQALSEEQPGTEKYQKINDDRQKLERDILEESKIHGIDKTTLIKLMGIGCLVVFVLKYEETGVITSKVWGPLSGLFFRGV